MSLSSSSVSVGLITYSPSIRPTLTSAIGPSKGTSEICRAAEAPNPPKTSPSFSPSEESTLEMIWVSHKYPFGNNGRKLRSINRLESTSFSEGRPSRFMNPPGKRPPAEKLSLWSTTKGKKFCPGLACLALTAVQSTWVSPIRTTTAPSACLAIRPVSTVSTFPGANSTLLISSFICLLCLY